MHEYRRFVQTELDNRGWTAGGLARKAGMHRQTISKILKDEREHLGQMPDDSTLEGIAKGFGIPVEPVRLAAARSLAGYVERPPRDVPPTLDPSTLPPLSSVAPFRGSDSLLWRFHIESKPDAERTDEEKAWLAASKAEQKRLGELQSGDDQHRHVPDFLAVARMTWERVNDLADSPDGDPDRDVKAGQAVVATADTLTDALLRLNVGPAARELIQEMGYRSHELMKDQINPLKQFNDADSEDVSDASQPPRGVVEEHFAAAVGQHGVPESGVYKRTLKTDISMRPPSDPFGLATLDTFWTKQFPGRLREIFQDLGREDPSLDLSGELAVAQRIVATFPPGADQRAAWNNALQEVLNESIRRAKPVVEAGRAAPGVVTQLEQMLAFTRVQPTAVRVASGAERSGSAQGSRSPLEWLAEHFVVEDGTWGAM
nr:helix-turn-helix transcriptional regulator [Mycobacterium sp. UM_NZ2]